MNKEAKKAIDFWDAIDVLKENIKKDYAKWSTSGFGVDKFNAGLTMKIGKKYTKIINSGSVWGFIVNDDGPRFKKGDILKAASWAAPATNSARGNIFDDDYSIAWTGPHYLK